MQKQLNYEEFKARQIIYKNDIIFVLDNLEHFENIGSIFRIADAFNIYKIIIISKNELNFKRIEKTARSCDKTIPYSIYDNEQSALNELYELNYTPINVEITNTSKPLKDINFGKFKKVALIVGNERYGISDEILQKVPLSCHIEMFGKNSSMNVATSLAIVAYKATADFFNLN